LPELCAVVVVCLIECYVDVSGSTPTRMSFFEYKTLKIQLKYKNRRCGRVKHTPSKELGGCLTATTT